MLGLFTGIMILFLTDEPFIQLHKYNGQLNSGGFSSTPRLGLIYGRLSNTTIEIYIYDVASLLKVQRRREVGGRGKR